MAAIIRVHHPDITPEEREKRMQAIKEAAIKLYQEVEKAKQSKADEKRCEEAVRDTEN